MYVYAVCIWLHARYFLLSPIKKNAFDDWYIIPFKFLAMKDALPFYVNSESTYPIKIRYRNWFFELLKKLSYCFIKWKLLMVRLQLCQNRDTQCNHSVSLFLCHNCSQRRHRPRVRLRARGRHVHLEQHGAVHAQGDHRPGAADDGPGALPGTCGRISNSSSMSISQSWLPSSHEHMHYVQRRENTFIFHSPTSTARMYAGT